MINTKNISVSRLSEYKVETADEASIQKTISAGRQVILQNHTQRLCLRQRIFNQFRYISSLLWMAESVSAILCILIISQINVNTDITLALSSLHSSWHFQGLSVFQNYDKVSSTKCGSQSKAANIIYDSSYPLKLFIIGMIDLVLVFGIASATSIQIGLPFMGNCSLFVRPI